jgi:hypothetical protein
MPKAKSRSTAKAAEPEPEAHECRKEGTQDGAAPSARENTFSASSGKSYAIAQDGYPSRESLPAEVAEDVVTAGEGDLIEVLFLLGDFGYGRRFRSREAPAVNEGIFRLDWVHGIKVTIQDGKRRPVEVDIRSSEFGMKLHIGNDTAAKLRAKRYRKKTRRR